MEYWNEVVRPKFPEQQIPEILPGEPLVEMTGKLSLIIPLCCCLIEPFQCPKRPAFDEENGGLKTAGLMKPEERRQQILQTVNRLYCSGNPVLSHFGLSVKKNMVRVPATRLPVATLLMSLGGREKAAPTGDDA
uniref:Uncharacterized protein n=1 Tax=Chromera velia CCMP2878 TaxID=1169474 RepID=A0A0G4I1V3_9ALVE|eukprot:Cvel_10226.t1-p1 / transcript=Cvel_10226.t1 / gene=Cvel_10226 / organism=Chromera_velia_CCMP2878 / gene_product=hypothetical protein / transcript_product=hypothetical protein / location=Cvel_scaffold612:63766-64451(-) / protein_length=133 / sequence_SO=supercontig / SO=protein_coding / is_pseudo=false